MWTLMDSIYDYCLVLLSDFVKYNHLHVTQVVGIRDVVPPPLRREFTDVYVASELMDTDLHHIIRSNQSLSEEHCQVLYFAFESHNCIEE